MLQTYTQHSNFYRHKLQFWIILCISAERFIPGNRMPETVWSCGRTQNPHLLWKADGSRGRCRPIRRRMEGLRAQDSRRQWQARIPHETRCSNEWCVRSVMCPACSKPVILGRVRLLLSKGHSCYRPRRDGERKRKSVRGCIVDGNLSVLALVIVRKGEQVGRSE